MDKAESLLVDKKNLPKNFPTHRHEVKFWEHLGRAVATYSFLEETLKKAIFVITATQEYPTEAAALTAYENWNKKLEKVATKTLYDLACELHNESKKHQDFFEDEISDLVEEIKKSKEIRNILCHGSWGEPNSNGGSLPFFVNRSKGVVDTYVDSEFLIKVQKHTCELACEVINSIISKGIRFPGFQL